MKTLNYIDPTVNSSDMVEASNLHTSNEKMKFTDGQDSLLSKSGNAQKGHQLILKSADGVKVTNKNNKQYIDFYLSQGSNILGHTHHKVINAIEGALWDGINHGIPTIAEDFLAESVREAVPSVEAVKFYNSGSGAVKGAIRLARAFTHKRKVIKFEGARTNCTMEELLSDTISLSFNDQDSISEVFLKYKDDIAAIFVEPVPANMGVVLPKQGFLEFLRNITREHQSLLIFDETTTGFRPKISGAQGHFGINPDLTILGKIIGGGFPVGAVGGGKDIISQLEFQNIDDPINSITATAGIATLKHLSSPLFYETLNHKSRDFMYWLKEIAEPRGAKINSFRSMFSLYFSEKEIVSYNDTKNSDLKRFEHFYKEALKEGVYFSPSPYEANFISIAHKPDDLNRTLDVVHKVLKTV
ncbi:MAG TPA: aminotransferase class III-fold pyridoxal phosphate-dependent enzyme [Bacteroidales bacterium]